MTKARSAAPGVKQLMTAASVAGTLVGWALFTANAMPQEAMVTVTATVVRPPAATISPPLLPTLVPVVTVATAAPLPEAAAAPVATAVPNQMPVVNTLPAQANPAPLREVVPPSRPAAPAPITSTRSSR